MDQMTIKVGTRGSLLALKQVEEVKRLLLQKGIPVDFESVIFKTQGDQDKTTPLTLSPADDFFTDALDQALLKEEIDIAIHSAKDLPRSLKEGLTVLALTSALDETDSFVGRVNFHELKPGSRVGTSSLLRQQAVKALNPAIEIVLIRGTIQERLKLIEQGVCDGLIIATAALKRLGLASLIKDIMPWEGTPLQGQLAVVGRSDELRLKEIFSTLDVRKTYGRVYLVGAGPGDPDLITLKGIKVLKKADCVFYDYLAHKDLLDFAPRAEKIYVGKRKGSHAMPQTELSRMLRQKATEGKMVVRLKGGDPLIFGRGADEIEYLYSYHIEVKIVPGISSATGIPSLLGIPLTARGVSSSVAFLSGHGEDEDGTSHDLLEVPKVDTLIFLMGFTKLDSILHSLTHAEWRKDTPIILISKGTRLDERIVKGTLFDIKSKIANESLEAPVLIIIGKTVNFWQGKSHQETILYTGTNPEKYKDLGEIVHFPMIEIKEHVFKAEELNELKKKVTYYQIVLITSRFAVNYFFDLLKEIQIPFNLIRSKDFVVIGEDTAFALKAYDIESSYISSVETSEGLLKGLKEKYNLKGKKILFPRSSLPNPYLKQELIKLGSIVDEITVYENVMPETRPLPRDGIRKIVFTSPSQVKNFLKSYGRIPSHWQILSKGPLTHRSLQESGYKSEILIYE